MNAGLVPLQDDTNIMVAPRLASKAGYECVSVIGVTVQKWAASGLTDRKRRVRQVVVVMEGHRYHFVTLEEAITLLA